MANIRDFEAGRTSLTSPTTIEGLSALRDLPVTRYEGNLYEAPRDGFTVAVQHGEHWETVGSYESSRLYGSFVVGSHNGSILATEFIRGRYRHDPDARSHGGHKGAYREDGFDTGAVDAATAAMTAALPGLVEQAVRESMQSRAERLAGALADYDAGDYDAVDSYYGYECGWEGAEYRARRELEQLRSILDAPLVNAQ